MNHHSLNLEAAHLASGGALSTCLEGSASGWTVLEGRDHEDLLLTRFVPGWLDDSVAAQIAQIALRRANLRGPQSVPIAVGLHGRSLVVSMRLERGSITLDALGEARAELLRFVAACGAP